MKKILIFSLCGLFSLDGVSGMPIGELLNPENTSVSGPSSPALPDIEEFPLDYVKAQGENVKSIMADVMASFSKERLFGCYESITSCTGKLGGGKFTYVLVVGNDTLVFPTDEGEVFFTLCCPLKGRGTVTAIADKIKGGGEFNSDEAKKNHILYILEKKLPTRLAGAGIEIFSFGRGGAGFEIRVDGNSWFPLNEENSASPATIEIPVTKVGRIEASSIGVDVYQYKNMCEASQEGAANSYWKPYFLITNDGIEALTSEIGPVAKAVAKKGEKGSFLAGDIYQFLQDEKIVIGRRTPREYVRQLSSVLEKSGIEITGSKKGGYKIQAIGDAGKGQRLNEKALQQYVPADSVQQYQKPSQGQQLQNLTQNNTQIPYVQQNFGYNMPYVYDQMQQYQNPYQGQQLQNLTQNNTQIPYVQQNFGYNMPYVYDQMQQYQNPYQTDMQQLTLEKVDPTWQYSQSYFDSNYYNDDIDNDLNWNGYNDDVVETGNEYAQPSSESQYGRWLDGDEALFRKRPYSSVWSIGGDYNFGLVDEDSPF